MRRRDFLAALPWAHAGRRLNVLFIVTDDMNTALGCYGHAEVRSPQIDRLAGRGTLFERAYCQFPLCQPSRTSLLSGRRPETTRVWTLQTPTRKYLGDTVFLPEHFRRNGYYTAHAGKVYHTGEECEDPRSWDEEFREFGKKPPAASVLAHDAADGPRGHSFEWAILKSRDEETPDGIVARKAVEYMEKAARAGRPFFVGAGLRRPHSPYAAPKPYFDLYPPERIALPRRGDFSKLLPAAVNHNPPPRPLPEATVRAYLRAYYACNTFVDAQIGHLTQALDRLRLWDNTVVVFFGDNGYHLGDHGGLWHKTTLFEEATRIPLIVCAPGYRGARSARLVELVDLYPTLTELCGLPAPEGLEGTSLVPLLEAPARPWKQGAFSMVGRGKERTEAAKDIQFLGRSVRTEGWRYTEWDGGKQGVELYDETATPSETVNLAGKPEHRAVQAQLRKLLADGWRAALPQERRNIG